jgi:hypothetical protein
VSRRRAKGEGALWEDDRGRWVGQADAGTIPKPGRDDGSR